MESSFLQSGEAEDVAGAGDAQEEEATFGRGGGDFDAAAADDEEMFGWEAFAEEDFTSIVMAGDADGVEFAKGYLGERTNVLGIRRRSL
jgi:hypothetical protein